MKNEPNTSGASGASEAIDAFRRYTEAFQARDPRGVVPHFHEPAMMITPREVKPLATGAAVEEVYRRVMTDLPKDYARTEFSPLEERRLGDDLVMVSGSGAWVNEAGEAFMKFGMTYTLRRTDGTWRIVVAAIHAPV